MGIRLGHKIGSKSIRETWNVEIKQKIAPKIEEKLHKNNKGSHFLCKKTRPPCPRLPHKIKTIIIREIEAAKTTRRIEKEREGLTKKNKIKTWTIEIQINWIIL